jgi:DNA-binding IclR family transcriptional regulator
MASWGFLTNHALVLIHVANNPRSTLREIAGAVGITERATLSILRAMESERIISRQKEGRRNRYWVDFPALLHHQLQGPYSVVELVEALTAIAKRLQEEGSPDGGRRISAAPAAS